MYSRDFSLNKCHSYHESTTQKDSTHTSSTCKSDVNIVLFSDYQSQDSGRDFSKTGFLPSSENSGCGEYYKRYEHDATPVKDDTDTVSRDNTSSESDGKGDRIALTESHLVNLENNIVSNISQETTSSSCTLDSSVKFFKTTVEEIFEKFYTNMHDFELYKQRYREILNKNREESVEEMEDFIKDMIHHIMSSESSVFNESRLCQVTDKGTSASPMGTPKNSSLLRDLHSVVESFKNDNYLTDSTADEKVCSSKQETKNKVNNEDIRIFLVSGNPFVEIKMNNRKLLSEINIDSRAEYKSSIQAASAEDIKRIAEKKLQLEMYERQQSELNTSLSDREIPVKISFAKKNIHLDQDFDHESDQNEKSFMSKICSYLCKRLRRTSIV
ncbi:uncharacterized protein [Choristoneura fumiferana]|uniref:uncharacterized protein n=1 Tax=Choristoneura fumiferana TaxID=7141 RepID=UPI003D15497C